MARNSNSKRIRRRAEWKRW